MISEYSNHSPIAAFTCTKAIVNELKKRMKDSLKKFIWWSDGCSSQFNSKYIFALMTHFDKSVQLKWHYNETHHRKGPMDGVGRTIKRVVFGLVKLNKFTINTAEEFATEVSKTVSSIQSVYLSQDDEIIEPSFVKVAPYIQGTLDTHYVQCSFNSNRVFF